MNNSQEGYDWTPASVAVLAVRQGAATAANQGCQRHGM